MAVTIATLKALVTADIGPFTVGMNAAQNTLKKTGNEADKARRKFDELSQRMNTLGSTLSLGLTAPLVALGKAAVNATVKMDSLKRGLTAIAKSSEEAERQLVRLKEVAKLPGLSFENAIQGSIRLQAAGISAKQAEASLKAFGNALATVGKGSAELDGVTLALSQIQSKGKVLAEEINQIAERVPQVRAVMVKLFGTADTEILQKAKLTSEEFIRVITDELGKAKPVVGGLQNTFENAQDSINQSLDRIGKAIAPLVALFLEKFVPALEKVTKAFDGLPEQTKTVAVAFGALTIAGGPILLLTGQILELGKAIGIARLAALGPVAGIAALIGVGAMVALSAWNADSDRKIAEAGTTALGHYTAEVARLKKEMEGAVVLSTRWKKLNEELATAEANRLHLQIKNDDAYYKNHQKLADANLAAQKKKALELAEIQKRILEAKTAAERAAAEQARRKAEAEANRLAAEAKRLNDLHNDLVARRNRIVLSAYDAERAEAKRAREDQIAEGAKSLDAWRLYYAELGRIRRDAAKEAQERVKQAEHVFENANRRGIGALTRNPNPAGDVSIEIPDADIIRRNTQLGRPDRRKAIITEPDANARNKEIDLFFQDFTRTARQSSRELLRSILGGRGRDRADIFREFFDGMKNAFVDAIVNSPIERLKKIFEPIALNFGNALQDALMAAVRIAQTGIGQMLGAVYQLLSAMNKKGGLNFGSLLGGIAAGVFLGPASIPFGINAGTSLWKGDIGGAASATAVQYATGGFGGVGGGGSGNEYAGNSGWGQSRAQNTQIINIGVQNISDRADAKRVASEFNQRLENQIRSGVV